MSVNSNKDEMFGALHALDLMGNGPSARQKCEPRVQPKLARNSQHGPLVNRGNLRN